MLNKVAIPNENDILRIFNSCLRYFVGHQRRMNAPTLNTGPLSHKRNTSIDFYVILLSPRTLLLPLLARLSATYLTKIIGDSLMSAMRHVRIDLVAQSND
jgi:hypothetical protein